MLRAVIIANIMKLIVPLGMLVWALFMSRIATYSYITIYALFAGYLVLIDKLKPNPDPEKWTNEEIEVLKKYHLALRFSFGSRDMSLFLNGFRWGSFLWIVLSVFNQEWFAIVFFIFAFFFTAGISVRLDPFFFLGNAVQSGQRQFMYELSLLQSVAEKLNAKQKNTF